NSEDRGTHVNISGIALAKYAPNKDNALKLMEFLVSPEAQEIYAERNNEYPVLPGAEVSETVKSFGDIKPDTLPLSEVAKYRDAASELVDRVGLDDGPASCPLRPVADHAEPDRHSRSGLRFHRDRQGMTISALR